MANIDSLQINISMASSGVIKSIDEIINALARLNTALDNTVSAKGYANNLKSIADGFTRIGEAVSGIDISSLKAVNKEVTSFANSFSSLQKLQSVGKIKYNEQQIHDLGVIKERQDEIIRQKKKIQAALPGQILVDDSTVKELENSGVWNVVRTALGGGKVKMGGMRENFTEVLDAMRKADFDTDGIDHYSLALSVLAQRYSQLNRELDVCSEKVRAIKREASEPKQSSVLPVDENAIATYGQEVESVANASERLTTVGESAGQSLSALASGMSELQGFSVNSEQFSGMSALAKTAVALSSTNGETVRLSMNGIAEGLRAISSVPVTNSESLTATANAINRFGYSTSEKAGSNITAVANGLAELAAVNLNNVNAENITNLGTAVGRFGSAGAGRAVEYLPQLAVGFRELMTTLANAPQVSENTIRLAEAMGQISQRAAGISNAVNRAGNGLTNFGFTARRSGLHIKSLAAVFGTLYANFFLLIRGARLASKAIDYSSQMTEAMNVVDVAFGKMNGTLKDFLETSIKDFGLGRLAAAQYASRFQAMAKTMGISAEEVGKANDFILKKTEGNELAYKDLGDSVADMSVNLTKLTADMASLYNQDYDEVAQDMQAVMTGMTRPLRKYGLDLTVATLKEWALANGLNADIEKMSQAEKTLLRYQYVMSNASIAMGDFTKTADTWANTMRTVKQLLQEFARLLGEAFINAFRPALIAFRNFMYNMLSLTQSALNAVGKLLGWTKIDFGGAALAEDMEDYADALDGAAGSAKKLKGQLRGIDELNNYTTPTNGGGGGGGADGLLGANGTDLWEQIKESKEKYESEIKSWYELGRKIADNIQSGLESIDWVSIKEKARVGATNFANFLNGFFKPEMFKSIGVTIAEGMNTGLTAAYAFGSTFDFENAGVSIREGIKGWLETFDWSLLGETINTWVHGFFDFCKGLFADKQLWIDMLNSAIELVGSIDIDTIAILATAASVTFGANVLRNAVVAAIGSDPLGIPALALAITGGVTIGLGLGQITFTLLGDDEKAAEYAELNPFANNPIIEQWFEDWVHSYDWFSKPIAEMFAKIAVAIKSELKYFKEHTLKDLLYDLLFGDFYEDTFSTKGKTSAFSNVPDEVKNRLNLTEDRGSFEKLGKNIVDGIMKGITDQSGKLSFKTLFENVLKGIKAVFGIKSPAKELYPVGEDIVLGIFEGFNLVNFAQKMNEWWNNNVVPWFALSKWSALANNIKTAIVTKWNETVGQWATNITSWWNNNVAPWFTFDRWKNLADNIRAGIVAKWNELVIWFSGTVGNLLAKAQNTLSYSAFYQIGKNIGDGLREPFTQAINIMNNLWSNLKTIISAGLTIVVNADTSGVTQAIENAYNLAGQGLNIADQLADQIGNGNNGNGNNGGNGNGGNGNGGKTKTAPAKPPGMSNADYEKWKKANGYALGGFPEVGSIFLAGETYGQTEWLGDINGRTGVVGGAEITGIRDAIINASSSEISLLRQQNQLLQGILQKDFGISSTDLFNSVRSSANSFQRRTGSPAF